MSRNNEPGDFDDWMTEERTAIAAQIESGFAQAERGELTNVDGALDILRKQRAERLKQEK